MRAHIIARCRLARRSYTSATSSPAPKPYYCTTPIFYPNAAPHVGHLYTLVLTDILKRWQLLRGRRAILSTGTDDHGMKIQRAAAIEGIDAKSFCDLKAEPFQRLADRLGIQYDHFVRTSAPDHRFVVQHIWLLLKERGFIYPSKHEGWYSVSDEAFYPSSAVQWALDPSTGRKFMSSMETGQEVEWTSENNYHFRLSAFQDQLLEFYRQHPDFILPGDRMKAVVGVVSAGLNDLSVSRPSARIAWGIPVPDDESQTIYVWLDALINYLTKANYPFQQPGHDSAAGWPADVHVIGKDILRFHCIYWPAFLMALDLPLPRQILTHAHWTLGHKKMSKSTGNVVNPFFAMDRFGVDTMRYFMAHDGGLQDDADYDNQYISLRYKKGLSGGLGNLASRVMRFRHASVRDSVKTGTSGQGEHAPATIIHRRMLEQLRDEVSRHLDQLNVRHGLHMIMEAIYATNVYFANMEPWKLVKDGRHDETASVLYHCAETLRMCGILLQPYMPTKAAHLLEMLGVPADRRTYNDVVLGCDHQYGTPTISLGHKMDGVLFPPLGTD